jgi:uncharacterized membrane protein YcjF (UPF0283 family)
MRRYAFYMMVLGVVGGLCFWTCLGCIELVNDAFAAGGFMGWSTLTCLSLLIGGFCYLSFSEFLGYISLCKVDRLARALQSDNVERARSLAIRWMHSISTYDTVELENAQSVQEIQHFVASQVAEIDAKVDCLIAKESVLIAAFVGISPWAMFDGALVAWRQLRLMRSIASNYGVRPSTIGTMRLLRRVLISVVLADVSQHATQWIASKVPSLGGLIPAAGQSLALLVLTVRVGKACQKACRPMKPCQKRAIATVYEKFRAFFTINKKNHSNGEEFLAPAQCSTHLKSIGLQ